MSFNLINTRFDGAGKLIYRIDIHASVLYLLNQSRVCESAKTFIEKGFNYWQ